jgi:hypothetical protein
MILKTFIKSEIAVCILSERDVERVVYCYSRIEIKRIAGSCAGFASKHRVRAASYHIEFGLWMFWEGLFVEQYHLVGGRIHFVQAEILCLVKIPMVCIRLVAIKFTINEIDESGDAYDAKR